MATINAIDLFSGCGGLSTGLEYAGVKVTYAVEFDSKIASNYVINHPNTTMINCDIKEISDEEFFKMGKNIDLVAGCPPCQGFTRLNQKNAKNGYIDERNELILEYLRAVEIIKPEFVMMENVPQIVNYDKFKLTVKSLKKIGYDIDFKIINVKDFGVPQSRKRLVMIGSKHYKVKFPEKSHEPYRTVRDTIYNLESPYDCDDDIHKIFPNHTKKIKKIISLIPHNGGSRKDLPKKYWLECHKKKNVGYTDVYGRMYWDKPSSTITGGCLAPSKGRFLHPEQDRNISLREAALLQTFPKDYKFDLSCSKTLLAQMVGNAIPPKFAEFQGKYIIDLIS